MNNFLSITKSAASHIRKIMEGGGGKALRIGLKKGGCAGMEYTMEYVNEVSESDEVIEVDGAKVVIAPTAQMFLFGTKIDYENQKILLYNKIENIDVKGYKSINFKFENGIPIPQFDISITLRNGETYTDKILFDSGASLTLLINTPYNEKHKLSEKTGKSLISKSENLHGESISERIAIQSINIDGYELNDMVIAIAHDKNGVSSYENYLGILGAKIISRFNIVLDYSTSTLYLKPNNTYNKPFEFPLSGIKLKKVEDNIIIDRIEKTSTAYKKGIRKGDKLISVNKDSLRNITAYRELLKKEGDKIYLTIINSKGETKKIKIQLKRLL